MQLVCHGLPGKFEIDKFATGLFGEGLQDLSVLGLGHDSYGVYYNLWCELFSQIADLVAELVGRGGFEIETVGEEIYQLRRAVGMVGDFHCVFESVYCVCSASGAGVINEIIGVCFCFWCSAD